MRIRPAEDADAERAAALLAEADDARVITSETWLHLRRSASPEVKALHLTATADDGEVVGVGSAGLNRWTSAAGAAWCSVAVSSQWRRRGIGAALLGALVDHLHTLGATKATSFMRYTEEGERWAAGHGFSRVLSGPLIAVDPRTVPEPSVPEGFRCTSMAEVGPEAVYDALIDAARDEPRPDPIDHVPYDDFLRDWTRPDSDLDISSVVCQGDLVVALTEMMVGGGRAQHGFTGTRREYRGRGLATAVKQRALRAAAARGITRVTTSNAEENAAMRAVNRRLGFEPIGEHVIVARSL